jgi:hypothetical protein
MINLLPCLFYQLLLTVPKDFYLLSLTPVAVADDEWINGDQQGELFEDLAEFSHCRRSSFRHREFHYRDTMGFVLCPK